MDITQFDHWGFAEAIERVSSEHSAINIDAYIAYDEDEDVYTVELFNSDTIGEDAFDHFCYQDVGEIVSDIATAISQFNININTIRND